MLHPLLLHSCCGRRKRGIQTEAKSLRICNFHTNTMQGSGINTLLYERECGMQERETHSSVETPDPWSEGHRLQEFHLTPSGSPVPCQLSNLPALIHLEVHAHAVTTSCPSGFDSGYKLICLNWLYFPSNVESGTRDRSQEGFRKSCHFPLFQFLQELQ